MIKKDMLEEMLNKMMLQKDMILIKTKKNGDKVYLTGGYTEGNQGASKLIPVLKLHINYTKDMGADGMELGTRTPKKDVTKIYNLYKKAKDGKWVR